MKKNDLLRIKGDLSTIKAEMDGDCQFIEDLQDSIL